jgi:hypothetical protein
MKRDDTLWKSILEDVFIDFLRFFYPNADEIFDLDRGFEFLDKELEDISPQQNEEDIRYVDKLVKVWLKSGEEEWILVHVDVQGQPQKTFPERMYIYNYRIRDRYNRRVVAWAILTDKNKRFVPNQYKESYLGTSILYQFNIYKVIAQNEELLRQSNNPFAIVILTVLLALKKEKLGELELIDLKLDLVKHLLQKEIPKKKIRALMNFLKHYVRFNDENTLIFEQKLEQFTGKTYPMGIEQFLLQRAEDQGVKKGIEKGVDINKQEVIRNARVKEKLSIETIANIVALSPQRVRQILDTMGIE